MARSDPKEREKNNGDFVIKKSGFVGEEEPEEDREDRDKKQRRKGRNAHVFF